VRERPPLPEGPYLILGLARAGAATARMLLEHGEVMGCDRGRPKESEGLAEEGVDVRLEFEGLELLERARTVVKSPGVPASAPAVVEARARGLEVVGELELAWRALGNEFVAVTGTNGKTTTVELLGAVHRAAGVPVAVAGNVGTALAALAGPAAIPREVVVVCEVSSFQLEDAVAFAPEAAVLLNLTEDHLDRHGTFAAYREAKLRIFARQRAEDVAVVPLGFEALLGAARVVRFGRSDAAELSCRDGVLRYEGAELLAAEEVRIRGAHNLENAMAGAAVALARGIEPEPVRQALRTFAGVPHRLEEVAERDGVLFVNDSKATNPDSARVGVEAFPGGVHLILGGSLKGGGFRSLRESVTARCRACYLIGEAQERLASDLAGTVPLHRSGTLERAVEAAASAARSGETVLLSPACASFDAFRDFEHRGDRFRALAQGLPGRASGGRAA
jgi:UDP-N-acetylmuramoylalanine--D-glutamate ligase